MALLASGSGLHDAEELFTSFSAVLQGNVRLLHFHLSVFTRSAPCTNSVL